MSPMTFPLGKKLGLGCCHALADGPASVWVAAELPAGHRHAAGLEAAACLRSLLWNTVLPSQQLPLHKHEPSNTWSFFFSLFQVNLNLDSRSKVILGRVGRESWRDSKVLVVRKGKCEAEEQKGMGNESDVWEQLGIVRSVRNLSTFYNTVCNEERLSVFLVQILWLPQFVPLCSSTKAVAVTKRKPYTSRTV